MKEVSGLHIWSLGYVTEDIEEDEIYVTVFPMEHITDNDGDINKEETITDVVKDHEDNSSSYTLVKQQKIKAKWLPLASPNRLTPPTVCKGETVLIYRFGNTDKYYWTTIYNELDLRKLEKVTYVFSNKQTIEDESQLDKVYYFTMDTINKIVKLHTDDNDGEHTTYDVEINTKDGKLNIEDGNGNFILLDSPTNTLNIKTNLAVTITSGATVTVTSGTVNVLAGLVNIKSGRCNINP